MLGHIIKVSHHLQKCHALKWKLGSLKRKIWPNFKRSKISEAGEAMPTKLGTYIFHINFYLHQFFELILFVLVHVSKGKFGNFGGKRPCPSNLVLMNILSASTCINFFDWLYSLIHRLYSPWSKKKIWHFNEKSLKPKKTHPPNLVHMHILLSTSIAYVLQSKWH